MNRYLACLLLLSLAACSSVPTVKTNRQTLRSEIAQKDVELVTYKTGPVFIATTAIVPLPGLIPAVINAHNSPKPADSDGTVQAERVGLELANALRASMGVRVKAETLLTGNVPEDAKAYQQSAITPYVLEVFLTRQMFAYRPMAWSTFQYSMDAQVRVVRVDDAAVIWSEQCRVASLGSDRNLQVERDEFASGQRAEIVYRHAARLCSQELLAKLNAP